LRERGIMGVRVLVMGRKAQKLKRKSRLFKIKQPRYLKKEVVPIFG